MILRAKRIRNKFDFTPIVSCFLFIVIGCATGRFQNIDLYVRQQNWQKAQNSLEEHIRQYPRDGEAHLMLAEVYAEAGMVESMHTTLERVRQLSSHYGKQADFIIEKYWIRNFNRGLNHFQLEHFNEALAKLRLAVQIDSSNADGWQRYGDTFFMTGRYYEAEKVYKHGLALSPDNWVIENNLAEIYFIGKKYAKAVQLCNKILAGKEDDINALMRRAYSYDALNLVAEAERDFVAAAQIKPTAALLTDFGLLYFRHEKYEKALARFAEALEYSDDKVLQYRYLGEACWRIRDFKNMARWFQKIVSSHPDDLMGWKNLAIAYEALGQTKLLTRARRSIHDISSTN